jgi:hypothetical protein
MKKFLAIIFFAFTSCFLSCTKEQELTGNIAILISSQDVLGFEIWTEKAYYERANPNTLALPLEGLRTNSAYLVGSTIIYYDLLPGNYVVYFRNLRRIAAIQVKAGQTTNIKP